MLKTVKKIFTTVGYAVLILGLTAGLAIASIIISIALLIRLT